MSFTDGIFDNGAYGVQNKSQIPTILGQEGSTSAQCSHTSWACHWRHPSGSNNYPPFQHSTQHQEFVLSLDFSFSVKIRLEITDT